jgi:hypothetical protein
MKRGCIVSLLLWAGLTAAFYAFYHGRFPAPADRYGALAAGFFTALGIGSIRMAMQAAGDARRVSAAMSGETSMAPEDGKTMAAYGPIVPLGRPLETPFSKRKAVVYDYDITRTVQTSDGSNSIKDYAGLALAPCAVSSPYGQIRLLGYPLLEGFQKEAFQTEEALENARQYVAGTQFEEMKGFNPGAIYRSVKDILTEADGDLRKDWKIGQAEELNEDHGLFEQIVAAGEEVCAIGTYSSSLGGLVPKPSDGAQVRLVRGRPTEVVRTLRKKVASSIVWGIGITAVANGLIWFILTHQGPH